MPAWGQQVPPLQHHAVMAGRRWDRQSCAERTPVDYWAADMPLILMEEVWECKSAYRRLTLLWIICGFQGGVGDFCDSSDFRELESSNVLELCMSQCSKELPKKAYSALTEPAPRAKARFKLCMWWDERPPAFCKPPISRNTEQEAKHEASIKAFVDLDCLYVR